MSITITAKYLRDTPKAVLVEYDGEQIWLPRSQIDNLTGVFGSDATLIITDWIANQKGITIADDERYAVAEYIAADGASKWKVEDMAVNPIRRMCICDSQRDAMMISAALEITKNKSL